MKPKETVDFHIRWSWYNVSRMYNSKASEFGGSMSIGYALLNIDKDGTPSTKLGPKMGMEARSLTRMIKTLEKNGWIEKKEDYKDKRKRFQFIR
jgi:DNA-binding MarR family transcriptional regulator